MTAAPARTGLAHATRLLALALAAGAPGVVATFALLARAHPAARVGWTVGAAVVLAWVGFAVAVYRRADRSMQSLTGVLAAYREGDFSVRLREGGPGGIHDAVVRELNALGEALREHRLDALEAWTLLRKVMAEIDVAVLAFDEAGVVRLANATVEKLVGRNASALVGRAAKEAGLAELLEGAAPRVLTAGFVGAAGPWELRRGSFRLTGQPHTLVVLADVGRALREQEREAWRRLIRVLGHEINNSLAPISSISDSLRKALEQPRRAPDWEQDVSAGLSVIARRAEALGRFMTSYAQLARLPPPRPSAVDVGGWVRRVAALEPRARVEVAEGPAVTVQADGDQLDQLLINLVRNAVDAVLEARGASGEASAEGAARVTVGWSRAPGWLEVTVLDDGPGIADATNLFVPFFTTRPQGSGIGLALSRQIAEAHRGTLTLEPRSDGRTGAVARLRLPLAA